MTERKAYDVTALGELLIDFTENGLSPQGNPMLEANPGGAPCNLLSMLSKLGRSVAFLGKVGDDTFGHMLAQRVQNAGVDVSALRFDPRVHTTLAFVHTQPGGDREFSFYRDPGADMMLTPEEVDLDKVRQSRIFHFGTLSTTAEPVRSATRLAVAAAREAGCLISFDPNYRPPLWKSEAEAREQIAWGLSQCDVLKISDDEILFMTGQTDIDKGIAAIRQQWDIPLVFATMGPSGSKAFFRGDSVFVPARTRPDTIETTGAGDTFGGCALHKLLEYGLDALDRGRLTELLTFANAAASIVTTRRGALSVMPTGEEIAAALSEQGTSL